MGCSRSFWTVVFCSILLIDAWLSTSLWLFIWRKVSPSAVMSVIINLLHRTYYGFRSHLNCGLWTVKCHYFMLEIGSNLVKLKNVVCWFMKFELNTQINTLSLNSQVWLISRQNFQLQFANEKYKTICIDFRITMETDDKKYQVFGFWFHWFSNFSE